MAAEERLMLFPVSGWDLATIGEGRVMVNLHFLPGEPGPTATTEDIRKAEQFLRLAMTEKQCDELAQELQTKAAQSRTRRGGAH